MLELSPIENAVLTVDEKTRELETLMRRYIVLSKDRTAKLNTNPLSMALNGAVDAPVNGGIPIYRSSASTLVRFSSCWLTVLCSFPLARLREAQCGPSSDCRATPGRNRPPGAFHAASRMP